MFSYHHVLCIYDNLSTVGSYGKCSTEAVSYPLPHEQAYSNSLFTATCSFRSTCRLHVSFLYKVHPPEEEKFFDVNSYYWRITRGLSFRVTLSSKGNIYSATLDIDPFTYHYFGYYKCIAREVGSAAVTQSKSFYAFGKSYCMLFFFIFPLFMYDRSTNRMDSTGFTMLCASCTENNSDTRVPF